MSLNESMVESAALEWLRQLSYAVKYWSHLASGEPAAGRDSFSEVVLVGRLRGLNRRWNPAMSTCTLHDEVLPKQLNGEPLLAKVEQTEE